MFSVTLPRRAHHLNFEREQENSSHYHTDDDDDIDESVQKYSRPKKPIKAYSCDQSDARSTTSTSSNSFKHLCSKLKRRLTLSKDHRTRSEDPNENFSDRRSVRLNNYQSFSSSIDDSSNDIQWPDFEKVYESIPSCLINALPGLDDLAFGDSYDTIVNQYNFQTDQNDQLSMEYYNLFQQCKRGPHLRRNAICHKLDKSQYNKQLDIFIQQLMIEKLMRTWT